MDLEHIFFPFVPICFIAKAPNSDTAKVWILRKPFLGPIMVLIRRFGPSLARASTKAVDEDEVDHRFSRISQYIQAQWPFERFLNPVILA